MFEDMNLSVGIVKKKNHNIESEEKVIKMYISVRNQLNSYQHIYISYLYVYHLPWSLLSLFHSLKKTD